MLKAWVGTPKGKQTKPFTTLLHRTFPLHDIIIERGDIMRRIIIAEDELAINKMLCMNLGLMGYETVAKYDGQQVIDWLDEGGNADLALVDVMMPKVDGFELLEPLNSHGIPVIFLTARGDLEAKLRGLTGGAEDYIVKPFEMMELVVRMEKVLERHGKVEPCIVLGDVTIDTERRTVIRNGTDLNLTPMEFDLLLLLAKKKNVALSRDRLLNEVWGIRYEGGTRTVDVHIAQLRKKTGINIVSVPKIGYRLEVD